MRIIIIPTGRVRMRIIIKTVQMYQKVRLGAKSAIYRILSSPKFFRSIPFPRKSLYHFPAGAYTIFWQVPLPFFSKSKIFKPLQLFSKQDNKQDNKQPRQWRKQFFAIEIIAAKLIVA